MLRLRGLLVKMFPVFSHLCYNIAMKMGEERKANIGDRWYQKGWVIFGLILIFIVCIGLILFIVKTAGYYFEIKEGKTKQEFIPIATPTAEMRMEQLLREKERASLKDKVTAREGDPFFGPEDAELEIVVFEDFGCPYCKMAQSTIAGLKRLRPDIKITIRDFPILELHPNSMVAAQAARCVWGQGKEIKYWRFRDMLYNRQSQHDLSSLAVMVNEVGADGAAFQLCMQQHGVASEINQSVLDAESAGVSATPTFFIDGIMVEGVHEAEKLLKLIE